MHDINEDCQISGKATTFWLPQNRSMLERSGHALEGSTPLYQSNVRLCFQVEDLCNGHTENVHGTRLEYYRDEALEVDDIMPHILSSEPGMQLAQLMQLVKGDDRIKVLVRLNGLQDTDDMLEPIVHVFEDVHEMLIRLLARKIPPKHVADKDPGELGLLKGGM